jgi:hypothetical protein
MGVRRCPGNGNKTIKSELVAIYCLRIGRSKFGNKLSSGSVASDMAWEGQQILDYA